MPAPAPIVVKDEQERLRMINQFKIDAALDPDDPIDMDILKGFESRVVVGTAPVAPLGPPIPAQPAAVPQSTLPLMETSKPAEQAKPEPITAGLGELYTPNLEEPDYEVTLKDEQRIDADEEARVEEYLELYPQLDEKTIRERVKAESAERSRNLVAAGSRDVRYTSTAIPLEYRKDYDPTDPFSLGGIADAFGRQTSIGVDPSKGSGGLAPSLPPSEDPMDIANREAIAVLGRWLRTNEAGYARLTPDEQRAMVASTILGMQNPPSIREPDVGTGGTRAEDEGANTFKPSETQGDIPDYSPAQMAYLEAQRASLTRTLDANQANEILGDPQWYQNPELKRQRLAADPQFEGLMGAGVYRYPSGAVVESLPMYALRMVAAPANFMIGGAVGLAQQVVGTVAPKTKTDAWQTGRANSELNPTSDRSSLVGGNTAVSIAFDNVKRNRGFTEEIYDLGVTAGVSSRAGKALLFAVGLGIDILAVPFFPGAGIVSRVAAGGSKAATVARIAGKGTVAVAGAGALGAVGSGLRSVASIPMAPARLVAAGVDGLTGGVRSLANVAVGLGDAFGVAPLARAGRFVEDLAGPVSGLTRKLGQLTEAPGDIRLIVAAEHIGAIKAGRLDVLPVALRTIVESDTSIIKAAIDGDPTALADRRIGKWLQIAIGSNPKLVDTAEATNYEALAKAVLSSPEGAETIQSIARIDSVVAHVLKESPSSEGKLYLLTNRVAVSSSEKANIILKEAAEHRVTQAVQKLLADGSNEEARTVVTSYLRNAAETAHSSKPGVAKLLNAIDDADTSKPIDRALGRSIIEMVTNDIALSGKYVAISEENLGVLTPTALRELVRPLDLRRGTITTWLARFTDPIDDTQGLWTPTVTAVANKIQQQLAGLPAIMAQAANDVMRANPGLSRGEAVLKILGDELVGLTDDAATVKAVSMARSIRDMVVYNRPTTFMSVLTAPFSKTIPLSKDAGVLALLANADRKLADGLAKGGANPASIIKVMNDYLVEAKAVATKHDLHLNVVDPSSVNELVIAVLFNIRAERILQSGIEELESSLRTVIPASIVREAGFKRPQDIHVIVRDIIGAKLRGSWTGIDDIVPLLNAKMIRGAERAAEVATKLEAGDVPTIRALKAAESAADDVLRAQKLNGIVPPEVVDRLSNSIQKMFGVDKIDTGLLVHPQARAFIAGLKESSYDVSKLVDYVRSNPNSIITVLTRDVWDGIQKLQYWFMLNMRTRFHGVNIMTAPFIIASTIGSSKAVGAIENFAPGLLLSRIVEERQSVRFSLGASSNATVTSVALKTPSGKTYTYGDLADLAIQSGIRTTAGGLTGGKAAINPLTQWLKAAQDANGSIQWVVNKSLAARRVVMDLPSEFASQMDGMWRGAVLIDALKAGSSETEAVQLARAALFDYGKLTEWEKKYVANWFMYYSFTRASLANTLDQLLTNPSRLANQIKASKGFNLGDEQSDGSYQRPLFYESGFMPSRAWLGSHTTGEGKQNYGSYAPPLPLVDSYVFLMKIIGTAARYGSFGYIQGSKDFEPAEYLMERANPIAGVLISERPQMMYGYGKIDDRHVAALKAFGMWEWFKTSIGEPTLRPAKPGETAWEQRDGEPMVYTFEGDKESISNYIGLVMKANAVGAGLIIADYAPFVAELDPPIQTGVALDKPFLSVRGLAHGSGLVTTSGLEDPSIVLERNRKAAWNEMKKREK